MPVPNRPARFSSAAASLPSRPAAEPPEPAAEKSALPVVEESPSRQQPPTLSPPSEPASDAPPPAPASASDKEATAALFRAYRALPLEHVLEKLGAHAQADHWRMPNGDALKVSGRPGAQAWANETAQVSNRGAIDLVVHALGLRSTGPALQWLQQAFPAVEPMAAQAPREAGEASGAVRGSESGRRWTKTERDALFERYKQVRLSEVLERLDAMPNQDGDKSKWKIPGVGNIITKGQRWQNVQTEVDKGFGGVALVKHALNMEDWDQPLLWMIKEFGEEFGDELLSDEISTAPKDFSPPERFPDAAEAVADYLIHKRGLPKHLVHQVIRDGSVYGSHPWHEEGRRYLTHVVRCVFLGPASAELRDTTPDGFKGCCDGSQTDSSGYSVRPSLEVADHTVALTEAAIDALSYRALYPGRFVMSTNGAGRFMLQYRVAKEAVDRGYGVRLALDADMAGDLAAQKVFNAFYVRKALSHHLGVPEERVDEWLLEGDLIVHVDQSPHHLFFNTGWQAELPVHTSRLEETDKGMHKVWESNGMHAKPSIRLEVRKDLHERLRRGETTLSVSAAGFGFVCDKLKIRRDRPASTKDWNEELRRLGSAYTLAYDEGARQQFKNGVPTLPPALEALRGHPRQEEEPQAPAPHPNPPPAATAAGGRPASSRPSLRR